jgi:tetratricopeptide (TPR) repeat protein
MKLFKRDKDKEEDVLSILNKGIDFDIHGEHEKALSCYDRALEIDPNSIYVLINKGTALDNLGRRTEALHCYDRALELAPGNIDALENKVVALYNCQRSNEVIVICDQALQIQPYNARILYMKGVALETIGKVSEAKAYLDKASKLDPKFDNSLNTQVAIMRTVNEKPISYYDKALEIDPNNEDAFANKSLALANMDKHKETILIEQYFLEKELKGNWRIMPTDQQSNANQQQRSQNYHLYNAADNTSCEIHLVTHDESRSILKFKNDANVLVTSTRIRYNFKDLRQEQQQPL